MSLLTVLLNGLQSYVLTKNCAEIIASGASCMESDVGQYSLYVSTSHNIFSLSRDVFSSSRVAEPNVFSSVHFTSSCRLHSHDTAVIFSRGVDSVFVASRSLSLRPTIHLFSMKCHMARVLIPWRNT